MKRKIYNRPVSVTLSEEMFGQIKKITDSGDISISDYIRIAIQYGLDNEELNTRCTNRLWGGKI